MNPNKNKKSIGLVGARGYVGDELVRLLGAHPGFELAYVSSRERAGQLLADYNDSYCGTLRYSAPEHEELPALQSDAVILALPNGKAAACLAAFDRSKANPVIIDLSADYRFDATWYYGLPELTRGYYQGQRRISNPGCYASAMQLAIAPMREMLVGAVQCLGVSGYSGAGTMPSDRNDPQKLRDNLMPYALIDHVHEREASRHLHHTVEFMPHVAPHFRGLSITANMHLCEAVDLDAVQSLYRKRYQGEPLIHVHNNTPWVSHIASRHHVDIGGFTVSKNGKRLVVIATLDNLLKGAATQALQNLNRAFGYPELTGIPVEQAA